MQRGSQQLSDPDHGLSLVPESRMKGRFRLCSQLGLGTMGVSIARRALFALLLAAIVSSAAGTMSSQSPPEASPVSLQQAASIALEKNPLRKAALADSKAASARTMPTPKRFWFLPTTSTRTVGTTF